MAVVGSRVVPGQADEDAAFWGVKGKGCAADTRQRRYAQFEREGERQVSVEGKSTMMLG